MAYSLCASSGDVPSIFSLATSFPSFATSISEVPAKTKRAFEREAVEFHVPQKRRRLTGRPRNDWTPTRLRKLVRLYLLTELDPLEISRLLQADDFSPCKRDVQKQARRLLQAHPNKIRLKREATKSLLALFRSSVAIASCNNLSIGNRPADIPPAEPISTSFCTEPVASLRFSPFFDYDSSVFNFSQPNGQIATLTQFDYSQRPQLSVFDFPGCLKDAIERPGPEPDILYQFDESRSTEDVLTFSHINWKIADFEIFGSSLENTTEPQAEDLTLIVDTPGNETCDSHPGDRLQIGVNMATCLHSPPGGSTVLHSPANTSRTQIDSRPVVNIAHTIDNSDNGSMLSIGGASCHSTTPSIRSLRGCLSNKYTRSYLEDVRSILEHFTLSGSSQRPSYGKVWRSSLFSAESSQRPVSRGSFAALPTEYNKLDNLEETDCPLSTAHPGYCWEQLDKSGRGESSFPQPYQNFAFGGMPIGGIALISETVKDAIRFSKVDTVDPFGNSLLHMTAILPMGMEFILPLISLGVSPNCLNNAGQTFLHILTPTSLGNYSDITSLFSLLACHGFDFYHQDQLGQSVLHHLSRPWISESIFGRILLALHNLQIRATSSRDYLGTTVIEQLNYLHSKASSFDHRHEIAILDLTCETEGHIIDQAQLREQNFQLETIANPYPYLHNYQSKNQIETLEDLQQYERHADLIRTILKAPSQPWYEDSDGRNGLHCLAEVLLTLPLPLTGSPSILDQEVARAAADSPREQYLDGLLAAGVDINNYDNEGNTPLMAFIRHAKASDSDSDSEESTGRILLRLLQSKANLHRRNRRGETALHIAVMTGCAAATRLLLEWGANVHARDIDGCGVVELGQKSCRDAKGKEVLSYAQIMLCISLFLRAGGVPEPSVLQEWSLAPPR
ncbi:hypothetical protein G7Y89_g6412 [Cudoniella acicularis]|uniref:Ankyrin n=1 Tax=Cudoniella acicularis TaxID=354080 RepID=A0A8H4W5J4_9HELO|nr:hypothetical protein G7Y89_g6412 [Cudoniella acicularis]